MARISDVELERLKKEVSLDRLVTAFGVELSKRGDGLVGRCPFHEDKTPSLTVSPKKNLWHCLGKCRQGGTVIDWVMKSEGVSFRHAVELLRSEDFKPGAVRAVSAPKLPSPLDDEAPDGELLHQVARYYRERLLKSPVALEYLKGRGLAAPELLAHFKVGFADRTLCLRLPDANRKAGAAIRARLTAFGVLRESGAEHFNGSVVVPLLDAGGAVRGMYGRKVSNNLRAGTARHLYLPGPHRAVFNEAGLTGDTVILCEAVFDAMSFWAAGFRAVTCAYGVDGFTALHLEAFRKRGVRHVLLAYDRDDAGDAAAAALSKKLFAEGLECWRVLFPRGMDANAYACKVQPADKSLGVALRQAEYMGADQRARPAPQLLSSTASRAVELQAPASATPASSPEKAVAEISIAAAPAEAAKAAAPPAAALAGEVTEEAADVEKRGDEGDELHFRFGPRSYRVRGLSKNESADALKVNVLLTAPDGFHVDSFDLYQAKARAHFVASAAAEARVAPEVVKRDVGQVLLRLEELQDEARKKASGPKVAPLTEAETAAALELLRSEDILERVLADFARCGVVGEETNKLVAYLATLSRKLEEPLAVLIQSSSAAGKSSLMEAVLAFVPEEDKVKYSAMTGQSLFYMGDVSLKHKVLAVVEEEGAARAAYALKLLQSEGELTIASTGKNPTTGRLETHEYHVEGPTQLLLTTTASELDEELLNRCLVLTVDEERAQTQSIHQLQREKQTLEGLLARRERDAIVALHQNAQRLLRPLLVANPYAPKLTFLDDRTRTRRDFPKYLTLIRAIALLHQHQRPVKTVQHGEGVLEYVEVTLDDVEIANRLAAQVLGRSLDELPPQTRRLLHQLEAWVAAECARTAVARDAFRFTRKQVRALVAMSNAQAALHLNRLVDFEHLAVHRAGRGGGFLYELLYDGGGKDGAPVLPGLADAAVLANASEVSGPAPKFPGAPAKFPAPFRGPSGPLPESKNGEKPSGLHVLSTEGQLKGEIAHPGVSAARPSYAGARR